MVLSLLCATREIRGVPIFPARIVEKPAFFKMCSIKEVVVVFPFEPVIPIKRPSRKRSASSTSLQMVTPFARAACSTGASAGTPGLGTRSEEHTSELQSHLNLVCRLLLEKKKVWNELECFQCSFCVT